MLPPKTYTKTFADRVTVRACLKHLTLSMNQKEKKTLQAFKDVFRFGTIILKT